MEDEYQYDPKKAALEKVSKEWNFANHEETQQKVNFFRKYLEEERKYYLLLFLDLDDMAKGAPQWEEKTIRERIFHIDHTYLSLGSPMFVGEISLRSYKSNEIEQQF